MKSKVWRITYWVIYPFVFWISCIYWRLEIYGYKLGREPGWNLFVHILGADRVIIYLVLFIVISLFYYLVPVVIRLVRKKATKGMSTLLWVVISFIGSTVIHVGIYLLYYWHYTGGYMRSHGHPVYWLFPPLINACSVAALFLAWSILTVPGKNDY